MSFFKEFKEFVSRGNVVDLAVGIVIGGAFQKIITSVVGDLIMPLINPLIPGGDWRSIEVGKGIKVGNFLGTTLDFIIVALAVFLMIKTINRLKKKEETAAPVDPPPTKDQALLTEIRDLLKNK